MTFVILVVILILPLGLELPRLSIASAAAVHQVSSVAVLPLDFCGKLRILRTMHVPAALHGNEASQVSISGLRRLRSAFGRAAMSDWVAFGEPRCCTEPHGMGLSFLTLGFMLSGVAFGCCVGTMAYNSSVHELAGVYSLLRVVAAGAPGHGPVRLLLSSAASLGFSWNSDLCVWLRPGLPALCQISSPLEFFRNCVWDAWRTKVAGDLSSRAGFRDGRYLDFRSSLKLLPSPHLRGEDKGLFAWHFVWGVWN